MVGQPIRWRPHLQQLVNRSIYKKDFPKLFDAMHDSGLFPNLEADGLRWYVGSYLITKSEIRRVWHFTPKQMGRIESHIIEEGWPYWES